MVKIQRLFAKTNLKIPVYRNLNSRVWGRHAPTRALQKRGSVAEVQSRKGTTFSRIENLWSRDDSCAEHFVPGVCYMDNGWILPGNTGYGAVSQSGRMYNR